MSSEAARRAGLLLVVSSPSGAGKTTLTRKLLDDYRGQLTFSISYTTRAPRAGERSGVDYHFVDDATFEQMVAEERFAEWATVHGNRYGTAVDAIDAALAAGKDVLFDIDFQGGRQLKAKYPSAAVMVFVLPPDMPTLASRLRSRATDAEQTIRSRLSTAVVELGHYHAYEYLVVNDDIERSYADLVAVYRAAKCRRHRLAPRAERLIREAAQADFIDP